MLVVKPINTCDAYQWVHLQLVAEMLRFVVITSAFYDMLATAGTVSLKKKK